MGAHVGLVSCVVIIAVVVPGALCVKFIDIYWWYWGVIGSSIFIIISVISVKTSIVVCCADVVSGVNCILMVAFGDRECNRGCGSIGVVVNVVFGSNVG